MSLPTHFIVEHFRAFSAEEVLTLRPITLVFGPNNAGKSSLLRLLLMVAESLAPGAKAALEMPPDLCRGGSFTDLASKVDVGDYSFSFGFRWSDGLVREVRYTLDGQSGRGSYIKELTITDASGTTLWTGSAAPYRSLTGADGLVINCDGLLPRDRTCAAVSELIDKLEALRGRVRWLDGVRSRPPRRIERTGVAPDILRGDGAAAAKILVETPGLRAVVAEFYARLTPPRDLSVVESLDVDYRITLNPRTQPLWDLDLADSGEGMAQVLPVLVAAALAAREGGILALEEPESHLHSDAQSVLAKFLCDFSSGDSPPMFLLETHSRVFLLAVQLAVAGGLDPDSVSVMWVDQDAAGRSRVTPVELLEGGHLGDGWPNSALAEDFRLATQFAKLSLGKKGT